MIGGKKENLGGGLIVYDTQNQSHIINCDFENLVGLKKNDVVVMPAVNFISAFNMCKKIGAKDGFRAIYCILKYGLFKA